jgi:hypothetical protein
MVKCVRSCSGLYDGRVEISAICDYLENNTTEIDLEKPGRKV